MNQARFGGVPTLVPPNLAHRTESADRKLSIKPYFYREAVIGSFSLLSPRSSLFRRFAFDESRPLAVFAGIWTTWRGKRGTKANPIEGEHQLFGFLTTEANAEVGAIHPKAMPVILTTEAEIETWMTASAEEALKLQRPARKRRAQNRRHGRKGGHQGTRGHTPGLNRDYDSGGWPTARPAVNLTPAVKVYLLS